MDDEQKDLKVINRKCSGYLAAYGDLQKAKGIYLPPSDVASKEAMSYGDAAADRYRRITAAKTKREGST